MVFFFAHGIYRKDQDGWEDIKDYIKKVEPSKLGNYFLAKDSTQTAYMYNVDKFRNSLKQKEINGMKKLNISYDVFFDEPKGGWYVKGEMMTVIKGMEAGLLDVLDIAHGYTKDCPESWHTRIQQYSAFFYTGTYFYAESVEYLTRDFSDQKEIMDIKKIKLLTGAT